MQHGHGEAGGTVSSACLWPWEGGGAQRDARPGASSLGEPVWRRSAGRRGATERTWTDLLAGLLEAAHEGCVWSGSGRRSVRASQVELPWLLRRAPIVRQRRAKRREPPQTSVSAPGRLAAPVGHGEQLADELQHLLELLRTLATSSFARAKQHTRTRAAASGRLCLQSSSRLTWPAPEAMGDRGLGVGGRAQPTGGARSSPRTHQPGGATGREPSRGVPTGGEPGESWLPLG